MTLNDYLSDKKIRQAVFARQIGVSDTYLSRILSGERGASIRVAALIEAETGGLVTVADLVAVRKARMDALERLAS
jgi:DNA-binding transcriptional regulator YdaS (Cro superfamily)